MRTVVLVHGYSVRSLDTYGQLPHLLTSAGYTTDQIYLSAFDSLNDDITCEDLANALEKRVAALEYQGVDISETTFITHSTGSIITRRWILNRFQAKKVIPSHFISLAGANHGSTLAQLGQTQLAYIYRHLQGTSVGLEVLQDLDYGSQFLLKLNSEWLDAFISEDFPRVYAFSLIGDDHSAPDCQIAWQTHENGSDNIVRISGGNLNYSILSIDQNDPVPTLRTKRFKSPIPHLILPEVAHTGNGSGILGKANGILDGGQIVTDLVFPAIQQALSIQDRTQYNDLAIEWANRNTEWKKSHSEQCNSTILFSLQHPGARRIEDSLILLKDGNVLGDENTAIQNVHQSIMPRQPIKNNNTPSSVSFYVNYDNFVASFPHIVQIQISSGSNEISYIPINYKVSHNDEAAVRPNEFTYVFVTLNRQTFNTYEVIPYSDNPNMGKQWPPLPQARS